MSKTLIIIIVPSQDNPFFKAEADAAATRARSLGYRVRVDAHDDDAYRQDNLIDAAIASNAAAIILDNAGADSSIAAVRRATQAGIPCFLIDREIEADGIAKAQIIADNNQGARIVAEEFAHAIGPQSGDYAELLGRESDTNAQVRTAAFHAVLDKHPTYIVLPHNPPTGHSPKHSRRLKLCCRPTRKSAASLRETTPWLLAQWLL